MSSDKQPLFRDEARAREPMQTRPAFHAPRLLHVLAVLLVFACIALVLALAFAKRSLTVTAPGVLLTVPEPVRVYPGRAGVLVEWRVGEGGHAREGAVLGRVRDFRAVAQNSVADQLIADFGGRVEQVNQRLALEHRRSRLARSRLRGEYTHQVERVGSLHAAVMLDRDRVELARERLDAALALTRSGVVAKRHADLLKDAWLQARGRLAAVQRDFAASSNVRFALNTQIEELPVTHSLARAQLIAERDVLEERLLRLEEERAFDVISPVAGGVVAQLANIGERVAPERAVAVIQPPARDLVAIAYLPQRGLGRVTVGAEARLRFSALPFQRYGWMHGVVEAVDRVARMPREVELPVAVASAVHRIRIRPASRRLGPVALKSGMPLEADVVVERTSLLALIADPFLTLGMRLR